MDRFHGFSTNRTICDVLLEIREMDKVKNYSYLLSLVEEIQTMGNRMEAKLYDRREMKLAERHKENLKNDIKELEKKKESLEYGKKT